MEGSFYWGKQMWGVRCFGGVVDGGVGRG
ncbi:MAG: hypothetical protein ACI87O_000913, partial [Planctomycetota bacterium]